MKRKSVAPPVPRLDAVNIGVRILGATLGAYLLAYAMTAAIAGVMFRLFHAERPDAAIVSTNLSLLALVAVSIWCFAERRLWLILAAPFLGFLVFSAIAWTVRL
jgi:hypothetical protein